MATLLNKLVGSNEIFSKEERYFWFQQIRSVLHTGDRSLECALGLAVLVSNSGFKALDVDLLHGLNYWLVDDLADNIHHLAWLLERTEHLSVCHTMAYVLCETSMISLQEAKAVVSIRLQQVIVGLIRVAADEIVCLLNSKEFLIVIADLTVKQR